MAGAAKLMTAGGGGVSLTPGASIASDVTVNTPTVATTLAALDVTQAFNKPQYATVYALTSSSAVDANTYQAWSASVNGSTFTVANPTGGVTGCYYTLYIAFVTANTVSFGTNFKGLAAYIPTATAGAEDHLTFRCDGTYFECVGIANNIKA